MADEYSTSKTKTEDIGQMVDSIMNMAQDIRKPFERRWYDNKFFDDGYHFRFLQRTTGKIVDLSGQASLYNPFRAIPKASRQIRGVANLLMSNDPVPVIYPERVPMPAYPQPPEQMPQMQQQMPTQPGQPPQQPQAQPQQQMNPMYKQAMEESKRIAKLSGHWVEEEFKHQEINEKLALMLILSMVNGVSYIQIWPDAVDEAIRTQVFDAFDIYLDGKVTDIQDSPYLIKATPKLIAEIKANETFDQGQRDLISADNKLASSEIKQAYLTSRFGRPREAELTQTLIQKEAFIKEYVNKNNSERIKRQKDASETLLRKKEGDPVIRHCFVAGNIWLYDEYLDIDKYPFVDFRMEPGPIFQTPLIERFIPTNKSLDMVVSRVERFTHTMVTGSWSIKKGESAKPNNSPAGQIFEYASTPPIQNQISSVPPFVFNFMSLLTSFIEEQGVSTSALNKIPAGVKAAKAIESLKESEYANLSIAQRRFKQTVRRIAQSFLQIADDYFVSPQSVEFMEKGEPQYFDIVGKSAMKKRQELNVPVSGDVIPLSKDYRVEIDIEQGFGYTRQGKQQTALELAQFIGPLVEQGIVPPQSFQAFVEKLLETYEFGSTAEFMEAFKSQEGGLTDKQIQAMKVAFAEVLKDVSGSEILPDTKMRIDETKVGVAQVIKDTGMIDQKQPQTPEKGPSKSISFKDLPPSGKEQLAAQAGINISRDEVAQQARDSHLQDIQKMQVQSTLKSNNMKGKDES